MKIKTKYDRTPYITAGKEYEVKDYSTMGQIGYGWIIDDFGVFDFVCIGGWCAHLDDRLGDNGTWEVVEDEE